ncbi:hypothetical protein FKP32DRAFT_1597748 [Trametes sanguinea]|nr:hypothetical protein FKP32DRAFT_1597748 [Trametes sanguinea]
MRWRTQGHGRLWALHLLIRCRDGERFADPGARKEQPFLPMTHLSPRGEGERRRCRYLALCDGSEGDLMQQ